MVTIAKWDQTFFDKTLQERLQLAKEKDIPTVLNRAAFFTALGAIPLTPATPNERIEHELNVGITAQRADGSIGFTTIGKVVAAKRASKKWTGSRQFQKAQNRRLRGLKTDEGKAWRAFVKETMNRMIGGRKASTHFIKAGWVGALAKLAQALGGKYAARSVGSGIKARGALKGSAIPATPGWSPTVTIMDTAQSRSEHNDGLIRHGLPALEQALENERVKMQAYVDEHFKENDERFNRQNRL